MAFTIDKIRVLWYAYMLVDRAGGGSFFVQQVSDMEEELRVTLGPGGAGKRGMHEWSNLQVQALYATRISGQPVLCASPPYH